jgi:uncharacterized protein (TIGR02246 family)
MPNDQDAIIELHRAVLSAWNDQDAARFAALFSEDGLMIGFDGSTVVGRSDIEAHLAPIFAHHPTGRFVAKVRSVRQLGSDALLLQAVAGMVPRGKAELNPAVNAVQTLTAIRGASGWSIAHFQNTPAAFHGRPELAQQLTAELQAEVAGQLG